MTHIARTLTTPSEPTAIAHSGAREELILRLLVGRAETVAVEVARRPLLADHLVHSRHQASARRLHEPAQRTARAWRALKRETSPGRIGPRA
eukprot:3056048-Prymnesium_polylepis.2